ncbi:M23 family metallopeptidase [Patescibacteria group bacterium]|nr:M23 family metallopeptidase [Patescibacteria group bacterium]MBU1951501.1 M23 family metallopeptidase [Patescibacteria group bacterium]
MRYLTAIIVIVTLVAIGFLFNYSFSSTDPITYDLLVINENIENSNLAVNANTESQLETAEAQIPIDRPSDRITKKPFGIKITPQNSPIQPERFFGYHTGSDYEIFEDELEKDLEVRAICAGKLRQKTTATGYGGVIIHDCELENQIVTVVYGHLKLTSVNIEVGSTVGIGDVIGLLGDNESEETDGERKHLHLSIHRGKEVNIKGYVQNESELDSWIDPISIINKY